MRTISHKDLPNADLKTVGTIPLWNMFPLETVYETATPAYIHYDGSLVRFFEIPDFDIFQVAEAVSSLGNSTSMQLYRYHKPGEEKFFLSLRKEIDYADAIPTSICKRMSAVPIARELNEIQTLTSSACESLQSIVNCVPHEEIDYLHSDLPHLLIDYELDEGAIDAHPVKTNLSFLKIGEERFGTIAGINNLEVLPRVSGALRDHTFLQRIVLVKPSSLRRTKLIKEAEENSWLIRHLR